MNETKRKYSGVTEKNRETRYRVTDLARLRKKWRAGLRISMKTRNYRELGDSFGREEMVIVKPYDYHVSCQKANGQRESFSYMELERLARIIK